MKILERIHTDCGISKEAIHDNQTDDDPIIISPIWCLEESFSDEAQANGDSGQHRQDSDYLEIPEGCCVPIHGGETMQTH